VVVTLFATHLDVENERKKGEAITLEETSTLLPVEAEQIAGEIIEHHLYLFEDHGNPIMKSVPSEKTGKARVQITHKKLDIPRKENEPNSEYLLRLMRGLREREQQKVESLLKAVSDVGQKISERHLNMAQKIDEVIKRANILENISNFKTPNFPLPQPPQSLFMDHLCLPPPNPQHTTNEILSDVLSTLSDQKKVNEETKEDNKEIVGAIKSLNLKTEQMETMFKENANKSSRQVRFANTIAVIVGILTLIAVVVGYFSYRASVKNNQSPPQVIAPANPESSQDHGKQ
jgi:hypothetical protein